MRRALIVGGANGIGLAIAVLMAERRDVERVYVVDKTPIPSPQGGEYTPSALGNGKIQSFLFDLLKDDYAFFDRFTDIDTLMITAGRGRMELFADVSEEEIIQTMNLNATSTMRIIKRFYPRLMSTTDDFRCGVMVSIAGYLSSPFYSVYAASKAALRIFIESVNTELTKAGTAHRILNVSPGSIRGTRFNGASHTQLDLLLPLATEIISHLEANDDLFIPKYDEVYHAVLDRYHADFRREGLHSYDYKMQTKEERR
ncbi:MAG: SDR family oxidoreductase [Bacteroidaceae bacterium]|nr:SDR family oxidoreductase [Bacteroidaceae bacterium]